MRTKTKRTGRRTRGNDTTGDLFERKNSCAPAPPESPPGMQPSPTAAHPAALDEKIREVLRQELPAASDAPPTPEGRAEASETSRTDWIPARMLNEFVYCPRLFFYEHIDGVFVANADTERGKNVHTRVDRGNGKLPPPESTASSPETIHCRSVHLGSERLGVTAKLDLVESGGAAGEVAPVDYKAGAPREGEDASSLWPTDRMQLGLQILILQENGYSCSCGFIYYRATKQRIPLEMTSDLRAWIECQIDEARQLMVSRRRPAPLVDSPKCPRCSLVSVCLPDETRFLADDSGKTRTEGGAAAAPVDGKIRRLIAARDDARALYLNSHGLHIGIRDRVLDIRDKTSKVDAIRLSDVHHVALFGNIQLSTQAVQQLCHQEIPVTYFSSGGWFYGITRGHALSNILLRRAQFRRADDPLFCLALAKELVVGKIRNARTLLMRNASPQPLLTRKKAEGRRKKCAMSKNDLSGRTKAFAIRVLNLAESLPASVAGRTIASQIARCGTSVAANYRAAQRARSKPEFIAKLSIVHEESDESLFWLELIEEAGLIVPAKLAALKQEASELTAIFVSSLKTAKSHKPK